jgi:hypothetical protein
VLLGALAEEYGEEGQSEVTRRIGVNRAMILGVTVEALEGVALRAAAGVKGDW